MGNALDEAIEKATEAIVQADRDLAPIESPLIYGERLHIARAVVLAALPSLAEHFAEAVEAEVSAKWNRQEHVSAAWCSGMDNAANVVRALGQESTE